MVTMAPERVVSPVSSHAPNAPATAQFVVDRGTGSDEEIPFTEYDEDEELKRASGFASSVARIHLAKENELGFWTCRAFVLPRVLV